MAKPVSFAYVNFLADLALEVAEGDPVDFGLLPISEREAYLLMATHIAENYGERKDKDTLTLMAVVVNLLVENFVLNLQLENRNGPSIH